MRKPLLFGLALSLCLAAAPAFGQDAADRAAAESFFKEALKLHDAGKPAEACPLFKESQRLDPKVSTQLNLAVCYETVGKTASAWAEFNEAATLATRQGDESRAATARERASALEAKLSKLKVTAKPTPGLVVKLDGKVRDVTRGVPLPFDPNVPVLIEASAPGYVTFSTEVKLPTGPTEVPLEIPELQKEPDKPPPQEKTPPPEDKTPPPPPTEKGTNIGLPIVVSTFTLAGVGVLVGSITGVMTIIEVNDLEKIDPRAPQCDSQCEGDRNRRIARANDIANASNGMFIVAGVSAIVGVVVWATVGLEAPDVKAKVEVTSVGDLGLGVKLRY